VYNGEEVYKYSFPWVKEEKIDVINGSLNQGLCVEKLTVPEYIKIHDSIKNKKMNKI
jgi:hypothetical protein